MNRQHLEAIRNNSCYPTFRGFVQVFTLLGYLGAAIFAIAGVVSGEVGSMLIVIAVAVIAALLVRMAKEASLMLADIADTIISSSARTHPTATSAQTADPPTSTPVAPMTDEEKMAKYGITWDGKKYNYGGYLYDKLSDAVSYASQHSHT